MRRYRQQRSIEQRTPNAERRTSKFNVRRSRFNVRFPVLNLRRGFTLVEMLVSVALVVLMMVLFAEIFGIAAGTISTQRGIAENDQRARSLSIIVRNDLQQRTFKNLVPFFPGESSDNPAADFRDRRGYFYISENDPYNDTDDVLQFTVQVHPPKTALPDWYYGQSQPLADPNGPVNPLAHPNQPDFDDGQPLNETATSTAGEVCYFLRNGNLYRRVLLLRRPSGQFSNVQPQSDAGENLFDLPAPPGWTGFYPRAVLNQNNQWQQPQQADDFWRDFDFSAHATLNVTAGTNNGAVFQGLGYVDNSRPQVVTTGPASLGNPKNRFGHNHADGMPREFVGQNNNQFLGRFTHQETSHPFFNYPQRVSLDSGGNPINDGNPMKRNANNNPLTLNPAGVVAQYAAVSAGSRRAEDLILPNVHSFDVKVWDAAYDESGSGVDANRNGVIDTGPAFADVSHNAAGRYSAANNRHLQNNLVYGPTPNPPQNRIFDTWHPQFDLNGDNMVNDSTITSPDSPPYHPFGADGQPGEANVDDDNDGTPDNLEETGLGDDPVLKAIRITIRYLDVSTGQLRQLTLDHSLVD